MEPRQTLRVERIKDHPAFASVGEGMRRKWEKGRQHSLTLAQTVRH
jgi:hypothetical protein